LSIKKIVTAGAAFAAVAVTSSVITHLKFTAISGEEMRRPASELLSVEVVKEIGIPEAYQSVPGTAAEVTEVTTEAETTVTTEPVQTEAPAVSLHKAEIKQIPTIKAENVQVTPASVSSLKVTWDAEEGRDYSISWQTEAPYSENIQVVFKENGTAYLTGLRENSEYTVCVEPILAEDEEADVIKEEVVGHTPWVEVIQDFDREEGWTSCFASESASGLTRAPSSDAIYGYEVDAITDTGICRFENGDYACAMGKHYGLCGDRFLVELDNGIQFTCRICDSKGEGDVQDEWGNGLYHWFGGEGGGKCIIEFIHDEYSLPDCVYYSGSWGYYNWNGLNLCSNIASIRKINY
jgi:hypothetical protein